MRMGLEGEEGEPQKTGMELDPGYTLFKKAMQMKELWRVIRSHVEEVDECHHTLKEIFFDIPIIQQTMKEI